MDILDILLDILLKPPQPFIGLFFIPGKEAGHKPTKKTKGVEGKSIRGRG